MNTSQDIGELAKALAAAQGELKNPKFDSTNPHFKSKYASLASVRDTVSASMTKHGISVVQELRSAVGASGVECVTRLIHTSGQWIEFGPAFFPAQKGDAQGFGAASTYARRFTLQAAAGVVGDDDDDGNAATGKAPKPNTSASELDSFPPSGPIGKAPARPSDAPKPAAPAAGPPMTREALEALPLLDLCKIHAQKFGRASTNEEIGAMNGDLANKDRFGLDPEGVLLLRKQLIGMLVGGDK